MKTLKSLLVLVLLLISNIVTAQEYSKIEIISKDQPTIVKTVDVQVEVQGKFLVFKNSNLEFLKKFYIQPDSNIIVNTNRRDGRFSEFELTILDEGITLENKEEEILIILTK